MKIRYRQLGLAAGMALLCGGLIAPANAATKEAAAAADSIPLPKPKKRPEALVAVVAKPKSNKPTDCTFTKESRSDEGDSDPAEESTRDIKNGQSSNSAGLKTLREAEGTHSAEDRRQKWIEAVQLLIEGLDYDPYNPNLNYNLAAAYARLGQRTCMLKFLKRVVALTTRKSTQKQALDRVTHARDGYPKAKPARPADPDFNDYRDDQDFIDVLNGVGL